LLPVKLGIGHQGLNQKHGEAMEKIELPKGALDAMMKEHALIRAEIIERLKTAFTHVAYAGAIVAFAIPAADKASTWAHNAITLSAAAIGLFALCWAATLNMRWVQHAGAYLMWIEMRVNQNFGCQVLAWEHYSSRVQASMFGLIPKAPKKNRKTKELANIGEEG
jgi:hypothetical protein